MNTDILSRAAQLSDRELLAKVELLATQERETVATLIAHLAVLDERRLYLSEACSSLFTYCMQVLHVSEYAAYDRMEVARAVRKYPLILEMLADGSLTLTTARLLAPTLTPANHRRLLESAAHKSKREVLQLVARRHPLADVPASIRQLPAGRLPSCSRLPHRLRLPTARRHRQKRRSSRSALPRGRWWFRCRQSGSKFSSRPPRKRTTCYGGLRTCCGIRFPTATPER